MNPAGKSHPHASAAALAGLMIALALSGCGNKGSLVLPAEPEANAPEETTQGAETNQTEPKETP